MNQEQLEEFVKLWQQYSTVAEVIEQLNKQLGADEQLSTRDASALAARMRKNIVPMSDKRCKPKPDYEALAEVARETGQ